MEKIADHAVNAPWPSLESASWWFDRASWLLIGSLVLGAIATGIIVWMGTIKEEHWDLLRSNSNERVADLVSKAAVAEKETALAQERIAELVKETARLSADAESSRASIATANARAEEARKKANEADLARKKLETELAPRRIAREKEFIAALKPFSGTAVHMWVFPVGSPDTSALAQTLRILLSSAGWQPWASTSISGQTVPEIIVGAKKGSGSEAAALALCNAIREFGGIDAKIADPYSEEPNLGSAMTEEQPKDVSTTVIIRIGSKP